MALAHFHLQEPGKGEGKDLYFQILLVLLGMK